MWHNPAQSGMTSRKASVDQGLRAMKVRHKRAQVGTRFFRRGYHRGYHGPAQFWGGNAFDVAFETAAPSETAPRSAAARLWRRLQVVWAGAIICAVLTSLPT